MHTKLDGLTIGYFQMSVKELVSIKEMVCPLGMSWARGGLLVAYIDQEVLHLPASQFADS